jgi:hypothetical protein
MKVHELIERLKQCDQDAEVVVDGYERGVNDVREVRVVQAYKNESRPFWNGRFELDKPGEFTTPGTMPVAAVYLPRQDHADSDDDYEMKSLSRTKDLP